MVYTHTYCHRPMADFSDIFPGFFVFAVHIEKSLDMPDWNLSCLRRITSDYLEVLFVYISYVSKLELSNLTLKSLMHSW